MRYKDFWATVRNVATWLLGFALFLAALSVVDLAVMYHLRRYQASHEPQGVVLEAQAVDRSHKHLGRFEAVSGWPVLRVPLHFDQVHPTNLLSNVTMTSTIQNYSFYDLNTGTVRWLMPDGLRVILRAEEVPEREDERNCDGKIEPIVGFLYAIVETDSNGDGMLNDNDVMFVAISDPLGTRFTRVATGVEKTHGSRLKDHNTLVIFYTSKGTSRAAEVNLVSHQVLRDAPLAMIPSSSQ